MQMLQDKKIKATHTKWFFKMMFFSQHSKDNRANDSQIVIVITIASEITGTRPQATENTGKQIRNQPTIRETSPLNNSNKQHTDKRKHRKRRFRDILYFYNQVLRDPRPWCWHRLLTSLALLLQGGRLQRILQRRGQEQGRE